MRLKHSWGWLLILILLILTASPLFSAQNDKGKKVDETAARKKERALIVYSGRQYEDGYNVSEKIKFYVRHFNKESDLIPSYKYTSGLLNSYGWIFYVGSNKEKLDLTLVQDLSFSSKKIIWIDKNLEQLSKRFPEDKGFAVTGKKVKSKMIDYKKIFLPKKEHSLNYLKITNGDKNIVYGWAILSKYVKIPYIIKSANFWYIADNPFKKASEGSSYLTMVDVLHNIIGEHPQDRKAFIRIDGINPKSDPEKLRTIVNFLYFSQHPFAMSVTPVYKKSAGSKPVYLHEKQDLIDVINDAQGKGGVLALNGYTHQTTKETGNDIEFGQSYKKSKSIKKRAEERVKLALKEMLKCGLGRPLIWHTPYYQATPVENQVFSKYFKYVFDRGTEPPSPYGIITNQYGQKIIPENLGYVAYNKTPLKETIPERAWRMQVVRDAYAGFAIQDSISTKQLVNIIRRIEGMGYTFISPYKMVGIPVKELKKPFVMDQTLYRFSSRTSSIMQNIGWAMLPAIFFTYYLIIFGLSRRIKLRPKRENSNLFFVFVVPALNEQKVIGKTLSKLVSLRQDNYMVLAMNDNSNDQTEEEIKKIDSDKLYLYNIKPPFCRQGKGNVLNIAYRYILNESGLTKFYSEGNIIFSVVDSDGGVDPEILPSVAPYFDDKDAASVQTAVKIEKCDRNILTRWQDYEFRVFTFLFQSAREQLGSVGLGGNGQFIRLSALKNLGDTPWTRCLTEDLDIGIRLLLIGWKNHFCPTSFVRQQAIPNFWPLVKQRTRWFQGHVQCWRHLGRIAINKLPVLAKVDVTYYLLSISLALVIVPANFIMAVQAGYLAANPDLFRFLSEIFGTKIFFYWYFIYLGAMPIFIYSYWKSKKQSLFSAIILSHLFLFVSLVWLVAGYMAIFRLFRKTSNWHKTARYFEIQKT